MSNELKKTQAKNESAVQQRLAAMFAANKDEIAIPKIYVDMTNDLKAAAVLDEIMFWTLPKRGTGKTSLRVFKNGSLWLAVRRSDWWDRKRLSQRQADGAIAKLEELDLIEKDVFLFDGKPTVHIRVKMSNFVKLYGEKLAESFSEEENSLVSDIADLYAMMGFPNETVNSNLPNGEMLNSPNGEIINSLQQPPTTPSDIDSVSSAKPKYGSKEWKESMRKDMAGKSLEFDILAGNDLSEEKQAENILAKEARDNFEVSFNFNPPWFSNKDWTDFANFVARVYKQDKNVWRDYCLWRETDGKYNGKMTNIAIRNNPKAFFDTGYPTFEARKMYWKPPVRTESSHPESSVEDDGNIYV